MRGRLAAAVVLAMLTLAGCGSSTGTPPADVGGTQGSPAGGPSGTVTVFAAASLTGTFTEIAHQVEAAHPGLTVTLSFGASSALAQQILAGAPADVVATADTATMQTITAAGLVTGEPRAFARNTLEIAVPPGNPAGIHGLADLAAPGRKIALCARQVPCGAASTTLLDTAGVHVTPATLEQDVKAVLTKVQLGEVDAGLVYRTDVAAAGRAVTGIDIPQAGIAANTYPIAALRRSGNRSGAGAFVQAVLAPDGQRVLRNAGFQPP